MADRHLIADTDCAQIVPFTVNINRLETANREVQYKDFQGFPGNVLTKKKKKKSDNCWTTFLISLQREKLTSLWGIVSVVSYSFGWKVHKANWGNSGFKSEGEDTFLKTVNSWEGEKEHPCCAEGGKKKCIFLAHYNTT